MGLSFGNFLRHLLRDALQTPFLTRILTLSANILEAAGAFKTNKDSCLRLSRLIVNCVLRVRTILHDRWDPPPYGVKAPLDQLESLSQARFLTQIFKRIQVKRKIEELRISLMDCISVLQDSIFEEARRTLRLDGTHRVVFPPRADLVLRRSYFMRLNHRLGTAGGGKTQGRRLSTGARFLSKAMTALEQSRYDSNADTVHHTTTPFTVLERGHSISEERVGCTSASVVWNIAQRQHSFVYRPTRYGSHGSEVVRHTVYQIWPTITRRGSRHSRCRAFTRRSLHVSEHRKVARDLWPN
ncbi:hypothetical protein EDB86DRAFT_321465 [Lactarius hatsudake]|nr:hypothetical protein EDB86DRAFT_321465 [Lactarius hatsudake]